MFEHNNFLEQAIEADAPSTEHDTQPAQATRPAHRNPGYQFPPRLWGMMMACYAVFFGAIYVATGGSGHARFAIVVSVLYTVMYFSLARIGARVAGKEAVSPLDRGSPLQTWGGPMGKSAVYSQVLIVPLVLALFGIGMAVIIGIVG